MNAVFTAGSNSGVRRSRVVMRLRSLLKQRVAAADDANIYVRSERAGQRVMASVKSFIEKRLRLKVNETKSAVSRPEERHFLGFRLRREPLDGSVEVLLSKRSQERIGDRLVELTPRNWGNSVEACIKQVNAYLVRLDPILRHLHRGCRASARQP